ncbi:hypothetical protein KIK06_19450 [Nocardiopsis sp. EMB25]|uniref:hypothetical protein n=1 Tax=Nocardiopsis TaxID=2013 RepID=UPI00034BA36F|nr:MULTISPECIES: hypothetical protein [Nocardiopsis]MCY9786071.1 hypothetical protein [Nocardiopsis sp. EMB25]
MTEPRTDRLTLRPWRESDLDPWAAMNADPAAPEGPLRPNVLYRIARDARG